MPIAENPVALSYLFADDLYLLQNEVLPVAATQEQVTVTQQTYVQPVQEPAKIVAEPPAPESPLFKVKGNFGQRFLILVHYPDLVLMEEKHLAALESTIARKGLTLNDVAILNYALYTQHNFAAIADFFKPLKVLVLGKNALPEGLQKLAINQVTAGKSLQALYTFGFDEMMGNKDNTRAFWELVKNF